LNITGKRLEHLFQQFKDKKILVIGDVMVDEYLRGKVSRLSPEAPVPIIEIDEEVIRLGGAANVALNVKSLGAEPVLMGVVGNDLAADRCIDLMNSFRMDTSYIFKGSDRPTTIKTRIIGDNQHIARVDKEMIHCVDEQLKQQMISSITDIIPAIDGIIIEDYNKGVLLPDVIEAVLKSANENDKIVSVDPKFMNFMTYRGATVFKPNIKEASAALATSINSESEVISASVQLLDKLQAQCILLTRGAQGISIIEANGKINHIPTRAKTVADVSGAGDTVISTMTVALVGGASFLEAASLANLAAGVVCEEVGIVPITFETLKSVALNN